MSSISEEVVQNKGIRVRKMEGSKVVHYGYVKRQEEDRKRKNDNMVDDCKDVKRRVSRSEWANAMRGVCSSSDETVASLPDISLPNFVLPVHIQKDEMRRSSLSGLPIPVKTEEELSVSPGRESPVLTSLAKEDDECSVELGSENDNYGYGMDFLRMNMPRIPDRFEPRRRNYSHENEELNEEKGIEKEKLTEEDEYLSLLPRTVAISPIPQHFPLARIVHYFERQDGKVLVTRYATPYVHGIIAVTFKTREQTRNVLNKRRFELNGVTFTIGETAQVIVSLSDEGAIRKKTLIDFLEREAGPIVYFDLHTNSSDGRQWADVRLNFRKDAENVLVKGKLTMRDGVEVSIRPMRNNSPFIAKKWLSGAVRALNEMKETGQ